VSLLIVGTSGSVALLTRGVPTFAAGASHLAFGRHAATLAAEVPGHRHMAVTAGVIAGFRGFVHDANSSPHGLILVERARPGVYFL
jgi:hypothetical protein